MWRNHHVEVSQKDFLVPQIIQKFPPVSTWFGMVWHILKAMVWHRDPWIHKFAGHLQISLRYGLQSYPTSHHDIPQVMHQRRELEELEEETGHGIAIWHHGNSLNMVTMVVKHWCAGQILWFKPEQSDEHSSSNHGGFNHHVKHRDEFLNNCEHLINEESTWDDVFFCFKDVLVEDCRGSRYIMVLNILRIKVVISWASPVLEHPLCWDHLGSTHQKFTSQTGWLVLLRWLFSLLCPGNCRNLYCGGDE